MAIIVAREAEIRQAVPLDRAAVDVVESAFRALASGDVAMPPVLSMAIPALNAEVDVKTAYLPGLDGYAVKISSACFDNAARGLPSLSGMMAVIDARTAQIRAVLLDNGYLTALRTAAAGAVAARHLAPARVETVGVLGAGEQARLQVEAVALEREISRVLVWARCQAKAAAAAEELAEKLGVEAEAVDEEQAVRESDLVVTATPATEPILKAAWLEGRGGRGLHITAMGSDQPGKGEIAPDAVAAATLYVADRVSQCRAMGELRAARAAGLMAADPPELGQVIAGLASGRLSEADITIADLTGTGAQDTAIAMAALAALETAGLGTAIED